MENTPILSKKSINMKAFYFLIPLVMVNACKTQTGTITSSENTTMEKSKNSNTGCPEDGTCEVVIHRGKKLEIVDDARTNFYPQLVEGNNLVVEYTFRRRGPEGTADGNYSETIYFEVPSTATSLLKENEALSDVKMVLGILGYRNAAYYLLTEGKLVLKKTENTLNFDLSFTLDQASTEISHIKETVKF